MKCNRMLFGAMMILAAISLQAQRIAVLSDIHVTPGNKNDEMLRLVVDEINQQPFDLVIMNGDLSNEGSDEQLANVKKTLDRIKHPLFVIPGNHENNWSQSAGKTFVDLWGNDRFSTVLGDSLVVVGMNCGPFMKMGDGHIKQEDLHWLRATLDSLATPGRRVLSFNHYPLQEGDLDNYADYIRVLEKYPVIAHINGHYHRWRAYKGGDINCVMVRALEMKDAQGQPGYGYSIIEIDPQWVHVYDKPLGKSPVARYAHAARTKHKPLEAASWTMPQAPAGFTVDAVWTDSASIFTRLGFDAERVYFGTSQGDAKAVNKADRKQAWTIATGSSLYSRPVAIEKGNVAIPTTSGIEIVRGTDGKKVKTYPSKEGPYVADGVLANGAYLQGGYKRMERRNPATGKLVWSYDSLFNYCQAAPAIDGNDVIFGAWDTNLRCLDLKSGKMRWVWNNGKTANMLGPGNVVPVVTDERVYIVAPDRYMTALDRKTGQQLWRNNSHKYRESLGHSADKTRVYAKTMDGELVAIDTTTPEFKELWTIDMGLGYEHAPCIVAEADGVVYAGSRRGIVTAVDPQAQKVLWSLPLGVSEINGIDIDPTDGSVWVSLIEGRIYRIAK